MSVETELEDTTKNQALHDSGGFSTTAGYDDLRASDCTSSHVTQDKSDYWLAGLYCQGDDGKILSSAILSHSEVETNISTSRHAETESSEAVWNQSKFLVGSIDQHAH
ncbi:uncharacterized protein RSE6_05168 [Rhynchosporium secalis]|uniref:DUF1996 domain-containing protein n=1 Tax=Rhynchosporium secalis TaxID=38038 RepID=A0A1E1M750_RHYSE|nr:uncharacterized protein RSE6_05168 [Rhynchosporium secalis]